MLSRPCEMDGMDMNPKQDTEMAQTIALKALGYIVADETARGTLLTQTGIDGAELRRQANNPEFLAGVLDFLTRYEDLLLGFETESGISPNDVTRALHALGGTGS